MAYRIQGRTNEEGGNETNKDWHKQARKEHRDRGGGKQGNEKKIDRLKEKTKAGESKEKQSVVPVLNCAPRHENIRHSGGIDPRSLNLGIRLR
jgi:hypothetical protein